MHIWSPILEPLHLLLHLPITPLLPQIFTNIANALEAAIYTCLWGPDPQFFTDVIRPNNTNLSPTPGREEVGLYPYRCNISLQNDKNYTQAIKQLFDPQGFQVEYGPTTLEIRDQYFFGMKPTDYCCYWNSQSWPFSTTHTLMSIAAICRAGQEQSPVTAGQYVSNLQAYARTQQKDGKPYVAESHYPFSDAWSADSTNHSEGNVPLNIAANPDGLGYYPLAEATYTFTADNPYKAIDGYLFYDSVPDIVSGLKSKSVISFSGDFTSAYKGKLEIWYANGESGVGEMRVKINQVVKETIRLEGTGGGGGAVRIERMTLGESGAGKG
ncbi:hypothetical protein B0J14DRAFT_677796 [Halenospora varia]|nr:hypothetical protein B0J14DRAFT_677796 [Halenospora varia]